MSARSSIQAVKFLKEVDLQQQLAREYLNTNIKEVDGLLQGFPRGSITEIYGAPSSGRTTLVQSFLASATTQGEYCVLVDTGSSFDPHSAAAAGVDLRRFLWIRCAGNSEHAVKCADMLIHSGGWGVVILDLMDVLPQIVSHIPISYWYRFRLAVENTPTILLVMEREPFVKSCAAMSIEMTPSTAVWSGTHPDFRLLRGTRIGLVPRKPIRAQRAAFESKALA
jgi:hypothetical protein